MDLFVLSQEIVDIFEIRETIIPPPETQDE